MKILSFKRMISIVAVSTFFGVMAGGAFAFNPLDVTRLTMQKSCTAPCDLTNASFSGFNLVKVNVSGANLSGANLSGATLNGANLAGATLSRANFSGAKLSGASFRGCNMAGANLGNASLSPLTDFTGAQMSGAKWIDGSTCEPGAIGKGDKKPVKP